MIDVMIFNFSVSIIQMFHVDEYVLHVLANKQSKSQFSQINRKSHKRQHKIEKQETKLFLFSFRLKCSTTHTVHTSYTSSLGNKIKWKIVTGKYTEICILYCSILYNYTLQQYQ